MKILTIIPARSGSKGIPSKNIINLAGKPLIEYTINCALNSAYLTDIIVSTDSNDIAEISREIGANVPFLRPQELSSDEAQSAPVILHALNFMEKKKGIKYDVVLMLQPTSPLRNSEHINQAIKLFSESKECDSVVSVVSVSGNHPFRMKRLIGKRLVNFIDQGYWDMRPRQVLPEVYIRNGAIYLIDRDKIIKNKELIGDHCLGMVMSDEDSINIDTPLDLKMADLIIKNYENNSRKL